MKAMILAAGRGERMRPLTDTLPKPLLCVNNKPLIVYHIEKLKAIGITDIVINHAHLGHKLEEYLGDGSKYGVSITYSPEQIGGLETAGGIAKALPLLGDEPFIVVNGDVFVELDYSLLKKDLPLNSYGKLFLVDNPEHNVKGDYAIKDGMLSLDGDKLTFSGIAIYSPIAFKDIPIEKLKLKPYFDKWISENKLFAEKISCYWCDVGTPERLKNLDERLTNK